MRRLVLAAMITAIFGFSLPALASDITIEAPWARASAGKARAGAAFMTINNKGAADKLIAAKSDISQRVELHTHLRENGMMKMRQVPFVGVPAGGAAMLKPGGYHVMFMGLKAPLKKGGSFPLTLVFEKAGEIAITVPIKAAGAMSGAKGMKK